jgi:hypothetical protein
LAVLVYAIVSVVAVHAETLCIGSDGHIAFEGAAGGDDCHGATLEDPLRHAMSNETDSRVFVAPPIVFVAWFLMGNTPSVELHISARDAVFDERATSAQTRMAHRTAILLI